MLFCKVLKRIVIVKILLPLLLILKLWIPNATICLCSLDTRCMGGLIRERELIHEEQGIAKLRLFLCMDPL